MFVCVRIWYKCCTNIFQHGIVDVVVEGVDETKSLKIVSYSSKVTSVLIGIHLLVYSWVGKLLC